MNQERTNERRCGWTEEDLFRWFDGDMERGETGRFEAHFAGCHACRADRKAYTELFSRLERLAAPEVSRAAFNRPVLAAVGIEPWWRKFAPVATPAVARGLALAAVAVVAGLAWVLLNAGQSGLLDRAAEPMAHLSARAMADGAVRILGAVRLSESLIDVANTLEPLGRSVMVVARAFQAEFLLVTLLMSLLALLGAVRLALGSAVERGVRRACLSL